MHLQGQILVNELLGMQISTIHNLGFYNWLVKESRRRIIEGNFVDWKLSMVKKLSNRL